MPLSSSPAATGAQTPDATTALASARAPVAEGRLGMPVSRSGGGPIVGWLQHLIQKSSWELESSSKTIFQFGRTIAEGLSKNPIQPWEADAWARGLKLGLIRLEGYFFRVGSGKRSPLSFFVRNDRDLYVGLRRESVTQAATYVQLITDYGYFRSQVRFESRWMDVAVYGEDGQAWIYAENKASQKTLEKLCGRLSLEFQNGIPAISPDARIVEDCLMKAHHIWRNHPRYFWGVCPADRRAYRVCFTASGFILQPLEAMVAAEGLPV